jgi:glutathione S-transferase
MSTTSSSYKLIYFDLKGRAEVARILFKLAEQKFDEEKLTFEKWPETKLKLPFLQAPVLEITENGKSVQIAQSNAIVRYLAQKFNLAGKSDLERAQADMIVEQIVDVFNKLVIILYGLYVKADDEAKKKELDEFIETKAPDSLRLVQNLLEANKDGNGFLVGNQLTYADVYLMNFYDWLRERKEHVLGKLPLLKKHDEKIRSLPTIASHLQQNAKVRLTILFPN